MIIGFGCAGYYGAKTVRENDPDAQITVISEHDYAPYNPMLTTYYVCGKIPFDGLFPFGNLDEISAKFGLDMMTGTRVASIDPAGKKVVCTDGREIKYDKLLIATGASAFVPAVEGLRAQDSGERYSAHVWQDHCQSQQRRRHFPLHHDRLAAVNILDNYRISGAVKNYLCGIDCYVKDGEVIKVEGCKGHPESGGTLCTKGLSNREFLYRKDRIMTPLKRVGERGEGKFEPITWEEAYSTIAEKLLDIKSKYGAEKVAFFSGYNKWYRSMQAAYTAIFFYSTINFVKTALLTSFLLNGL